MMIANRRYPGSRPFQDTPLDRQLFRGREDEKKALLHLILAEDLVLLYAKSGMGKTSLLNAGILQQLREREFFPFIIRLNQPQQDLVPTVRQQIEEQAERQGLEVEIEREGSGHLWRYFHALRLWQGDVLMTPILVFDQFEELFTIIPESPRRNFLRQFASLARRTQSDEARSWDDVETPTKAPPLKMVLSVREDHLGELEEVASEVPQVMHHRFRLTSLTREQARCAIQEPAALDAEGIPGQQFDYEPAAIDEMLDFLCARRIRTGTVMGNEVEPFQLQILCQHIEEKVLDRQQRGAGVVSVSASDLGGREGMEAILQEFYNRQISQIPEQDREAVRRLCERGLISETEKRLSLEEEDIESRFGVCRTLLETMVYLRLIRAEPRVGSVYYELSHDTLVAPILKDRISRDPEAILRTAEDLRVAGDYSRAYDAYERVIQLDRKHELAYGQYAGLLLQLGRVDSALDVLNRAIEEAGVKSTFLYKLLGEVQATRSDYKKAIRAYQEALKLNDGLASIHSSLGEAYRKDNQLERSVEAYERAVALDKKSPNAYQQLGVLYIGKGEPEKALDVFQRAIEVDQEFAYIFEELVKESKAHGALDFAKQLCKLALATHSQNSGVYFQVGYELGQLQEFEAAAEACEKSASLDRSEPATLSNWGYYLSQLKRFEDAIEKCRGAVDVDPKFGLAYRNWAGALWKLGRKPEALEVYEKAVRANPEDAETYESWGWSLGELGRREEAIEKYKRATDLLPLAGAYNNWGAMLGDLGRFEEAIGKYRQAVEVDPKHGLAYRNWAEALWKLDRKEESLMVYEKAVVATPEDSNTYASWGWSLGELGRQEEAIEKYKKAMELTPGANVNAFYNWGWSLLRMGQHEEALEKFRRTLVIDPRFGAAWASAAEALADLGRTEEALEVLAKAVASGPDGSKDFMYLGWGYFVCGEYQKSIEWTRKSLSLDRDSVAAQCNLALATLHLGNLEEARQQYQEAIEVALRLKYPKSLKDNAIEDLQKALGKNPSLAGGEEMLAMVRQAYEESAHPSASGI